MLRLLISLLYVTGVAYAQAVTADTLTGEITITDTEEEKRSYEDNQEMTINAMKKLQAVIDSGGVGQLPTLDGEMLYYLAAVYFNCSITKGICPEILDAVLEFDLINSAKSGKASCPITTKFWRLWLTNGMEDKIRYRVHIGHAKAYNDFNRDQRPGYIKCESTITKQMGPDFLAKRYKDSAVHRSIGATAVLLLESFKSKIPNVFTTVK